MKFCFVLGTRPEIIKFSPIIHEFEKNKSNFFVIHTNQHYSAMMDSVFFRELQLPQPKYNLRTNKETKHGRMVAKMLDKTEAILISEKPDIVLVQGDTNSALAGALAAAKLQIPVAHVESGLRSYDRTMPEEVNRVLIDHLSTYLFAPTIKQKKILINEGINRKQIFVTGNTIVDAVFQSLAIAKKKGIQPPKSKYILLTMHRPSNVDSKIGLSRQLQSLNKLAQEQKIQIIFPIHPRTKNMMKNHGIQLNKNIIKGIKPVGFLYMLILESGAELIITDSGGVQEEACILHVPCLTLRENTERPETIEVGANLLVGNNRMKLFQGAKLMIKKNSNWRNPFGDGNAAKKITSVLLDKVK